MPSRPHDWLLEATEISDTLEQIKKMTKMCLREKNRGK